MRMPMHSYTPLDDQVLVQMGSASGNTSNGAPLLITEEGCHSDLKFGRVWVAIDVIATKIMFLQNKQSGVLIEVLDVKALIDPLEGAIPGRIQEGQEEQDPEKFTKTELVFPSGENLPRCWMDVNYRTN
jgi:hypothetical protein